MAKENNRKPRYVGKAIDIITELRINRERGIVVNFNQYTLPVLKQCGFFHGGPITDYLVDMTGEGAQGVTTEQLFEGYLAKRVEELKEALGGVPPSPYRIEQEKFSARQTFDEEIMRFYRETPRAGLSDTALKYIRFMPANMYFSKVAGGEYELDNETYMEDACAIYAETPEELKAYSVLEKVASALEALEIPAGFKLDAFFGQDESGRYGVKKEIDIEAWRQLVKVNS